MSSSTVFQFLKPVCVPLVKNPSCENFNNALKILSEITQESIKEKPLLEYAIFPFKLSIQNAKLGEKEEILCFRCLATLFSKCSRNIFKVDTLLWVFNMFSIYFAPKEMLSKNPTIDKEVTQKIGKSEEQKFATLDIMSSILSCVNDDVLLETYREENNLPLIGHIFSIVLELIENEKNKELQVKSIICLKLLSGSNSCIASRKVLADCLSSFFPGIALTFNTFLTASKNQSTKLLVPALDTLCFVTCLVLNDVDFPQKRKITIDSIQDLMKVEVISEQINETVADERKIRIKRNITWFHNTSSHMETVFQNIIPIVMMHDNVKTRIAVIDFIDKLMKDCIACLKLSVPDFLDALAKFSSDLYDEVREKSKLVLESTTILYQEKGDVSLSSILQKKLNSLFLSLPRIISSGNEIMKLAHLCIIKGYLVMFGKAFEEFLYGSSHLETFFSALLQVLEFETNGVSLVEEKTQMSHLAIDFDKDDKNNDGYYNKQFKYFCDSNILAVIRDIVKQIVLNGSIDVIVDHLLGSCIDNARLKLQTVFVLNEVIKACEDVEGIDVSLYVDQITAAFLQEHLWKVPISNDHLNFIETTNHSNHSNKKILDFVGLSLVDETKETQRARYSDLVIPFETLHNNIQLICLLLEGFSRHASVLKTNYNIYLIQTLYPILEKVGSVNANISKTALQVLNDITNYCSYESVSDLIIFNSDYLINAVTLQFRNLVYGSAAPAVLSVILKLCNSDIMPIVCDTAEDVFTNLDEYQEEVGEMMLNVLKYFAIAVDKWYNSSKVEGANITKQKSMSTTDVNNNDVTVDDFLKEYSKLVTVAHGKYDETEDEEEQQEEMPSETSVEEGEEASVKKEPPLHYQVVIKSLQRCTYYNAANDRAIQIKSLETTYHGVVALRERENDLLPVLHKLWPSIIPRLKGKDLVIVLKALDVVSCMVKYSSDFLRKRLSTEFLPVAVQFLNEHRSSFAKNKSQFTQLHKVLNKLILFLGEILVELDVGLKQFCEIGFACVPYLSCELHDSVQAATVATMKKLFDIQPDVIWLLLTSLSRSKELSNQHSIFPRLQLPEKASKRNVYTDNVSRILHERCS